MGYTKHRKLLERVQLTQSKSSIWTSKNLTQSILLSLTASVFVSGSAMSSVSEKVSVSGFGSIYAGQTLKSGEVLMADFASVGQYSNELSFKPDTILGLQASTVLSDDLSVTAQVVLKGSDDFEPEMTSLYFTYRPSDHLTLMAGRRPIPMYYFSEYYEVGYAYPWVRPPANLYWWYITEMDGLFGSYSFNVAGTDHSISLFYGNGESKNDKMINYYFPIFDRSDEEWTDIAGLNWNIAGDFYDLRFVYFTHDALRTQYSVGRPNTLGIFKQEFFGIGGSIHLNKFTVLFDYNDVTRESSRELGVEVDRVTKWPTYLISLIYNIGNYQPFISYSKADNSQKDILNDTLGSEDDYEQHELYSLGLRYNFASNAAFKAQIDIFDDQGFAPRGWDIHGDSTTLTLGIDFIF